MIDIIIPAYNAHKTLPKTLASIASQYLSDLVHVTIVDDCSDEPYDVSGFASLLKINVIRLRENAGVGVVRQIGLASCNHKYVVFVDADDYFTTSFALDELIGPLEAHPECVMTTATFYEETVSGRVVPHGMNISWLFAKMIRREFIDQHQITFPTLRACEDVGFLTKIRLRLSNEQTIAEIDKPLYFWSFSNTSITRANDFDYSYGKGLVGFVDCKIEAMSMPDILEERILAEILDTFAYLYGEYRFILHSRPERLINVVPKMKEFYDLYYDKYQLDVQSIDNVYQAKKKFIDDRHGETNPISMQEFINAIKE